MSIPALCAELHETGSALEAAAVMGPGSAIKIDPATLGRLMLRARATIWELHAAGHLPQHCAISTGDATP